MGKKIVWVVVSCIMVLSLVLASCGGGTQPTATQGQGEGSYAPITEPKYGGTMTTFLQSDWTTWDPMKAQDIRVSHIQFTHNEPYGGDWTKGPQGSHQTNWDWGFVGNVNLLAPEIAESWEFPDDTTIIFHVRQGVHFQNKAPANGREMTADDWVWSIEQAFNNPTNWQYNTYPPGDPRRPTSIKALDKYTVEVKTPAESQGIMFLEIGGNNHIKCPEVWDNGGDMTTWDKVVGTGPWIISDYTSGSAVHLTKNEDYYEEDPLHPGNKVPYADKLTLLVIPDLATRLTATRTGKLDWTYSVTHDDATQLLSQLSDLQSYKRISSQYVLSGRVDKPELPFKDIRVRRAMCLAINQPEILKDYMKGDGELLAFPYPPGPDWSNYYTPMDQLPADTQELFTYNPDKAKQLLAEAGYPDGFSATVEVSSLEPYADEVAMLSNYLEKVGIKLNIEVEEVGLWNSIDAAQSQKEMWYGMAKGIWNPAEQLMTKASVYSNDAMVNDPYYEELGKSIAANMVAHPDKYFADMKAEGVYTLSHAWYVWMPVPYIYNLWWPWLQNYYGIGWTGWADIWDWVKFLWIDEQMKTGMGY